MFGYCNCILEIDLTLEKITKTPLDEKLVKKYIGGSGLGAALFKECTKGVDIKKIEPLSPDNPLILVTGPMTGSTVPSANRFSICARSPLTNIWGEANAGGFFGSEIKKAGYDAIIIKGASARPMILSINNHNIELIPADELWGKDTYTTNDTLSERGRVLSIGEAGEKLTPLACIAAGKHNFFGRTGLGAVMGSKKLKAITVKGSGKYNPADSTTLNDISKRMIRKQKEHGFIDVLSKIGSISGVEAGMNVGDLPTKNWQLGVFKWAEKIGGGAMAENYSDGSATCYACSVACKRKVKVKSEKYSVPSSAGPEYETSAAFGSMCLNNNLESILKANELCNRYGLDTISTGSIISLSFECYEKGYITKEDTDGLELNWGDPDVIIELINQIGQVKGFGKRLARGVDKFAAELDPKVKEFVTTVKGLPAPFHDPRLLWGLGLEYATGIVGASHVVSSVMFPELGMVVSPEIYGTDSFIPPSLDNKALLVKRGQDYGAACYQSCSFCVFGAMPFDHNDVIGALNAATGFDYDLEEFMQAGERIWCLKRVLNNDWGVRKRDDTLPRRLRQGVIGGPNNGVSPLIDDMIEAYYQIRGLDNNGFLQKEVIERVNL